jgi:hypothetical protein
LQEVVITKGVLIFSGAVGSVQLYRLNVNSCHIRGLPIGSIRRPYVD